MIRGHVLAILLKSLLALPLVVAIVLLILKQSSEKKDEICDSLQISKAALDIVGSDESRAILVIESARGDFELMVVFKNRKNNVWYIPSNVGYYLGGNPPISRRYAKKFTTKPTQQDVRTFAIRYGLQDVLY